jgi:hypothetical protein
MHSQPSAVGAIRDFACLIEGGITNLLRLALGQLLLGAVTREILGLMLNPFNRTLQPVLAMLASICT